MLAAQTDARHWATASNAGGITPQTHGFGALCRRRVESPALSSLRGELGVGGSHGQRRQTLTATHNMHSGALRTHCTQHHPAPHDTHSALRHCIAGDGLHGALGAVPTYEARRTIRYGGESRTASSASVPPYHEHAHHAPPTEKTVSTWRQLQRIA